MTTTITFARKLLGRLAASLTIGFIVLIDRRIAAV